MNRSLFCTVLEALIAEFENDHEEFTGVTENEEGPFEYWMQELNNLYENTR